jgi:hypothetical protein
VKPANILLEAGHAVLADFGIARAVEGGPEGRLTQTGTSLGTPVYMSPEQAAGEPELDGRSDQYALGCVLYEMLAGRPPFTGVRADSVMRQHLVETPTPISQLRPTVPVELGATLAKALAKAPADRFETATEFGKVLERLVATPAGGTAAVAVGGPGRSWRVGIAAVVAAITVAYVMVSRAESSDLVPNRVTVAVFENRTDDPALDQVGRVAADRIAEGLLRIGLVEVYPSASALLLAREEEADGTDRWQRISDRTRAGEQ